MAIQLAEINGGQVLEVTLTGKLTSTDYASLGPELGRLVKQHGKVNVLLLMLDFHGWDLGAAWEEMKLDVRHVADVKRLAMVGDRRWEKDLSAFCKPFTTATIRYFDAPDLARARAWVEEANTASGARG